MFTQLSRKKIILSFGLFCLLVLPLAWFNKQYNMHFVWNFVSGAIGGVICMLISMFKIFKL